MFGWSLHLSLIELSVHGLSMEVNSNTVTSYFFSLLCFSSDHRGSTILSSLELWICWFHVIAKKKKKIVRSPWFRRFLFFSFLCFDWDSTITIAQQHSEHVLSSDLYRLNVVPLEQVVPCCWTIRSCSRCFVFLEQMVVLKLIEYLILVNEVEGDWVIKVSFI